MPNSFTNLTYHLAFGTADGQPLILPDWREELCRYLGGVVNRLGGVAYEISAMPEHVHLLASLRAEPSIASVLKSIKSSSSRWAKERGHVPRSFRWEDGYHGFSISATRLERVRRYVRHQDKHHRATTFREEVEAILRRYPSILHESGFHLIYHIVFGTKYRLSMILPEWKSQLYRCIRGIVERQRGTLFEINGMPDHVHLLAGFRAEPSVSAMLRLIKANSSKWLNESGLMRERFGWQVGYSAFTVSASQLLTVRRYIQRQEEHHASRSFDAEMKALLCRVSVQPSPRGDGIEPGA